MLADQAFGSLGRDLRRGRGTLKEAGTTARRATARSFLALALALGALGISPAAAEDPEAALDRAKAEYARIRQELDAATARWQEAEFRLVNTRAEIVLARTRIAGFETKIGRIQTRLEARAVIAFQNGPASTIDLLLSSGSFTDFSDRLEFLGTMAQGDVDLVLDLEILQEDLRRERDDLLALEERQAEAVDELRSSRTVIQDKLGEAADTLAEATERYKEAQAAARQLTILGQTPQPGAAIQVCPVAGPNSFVDSFGWPRVGHTHQGIDLIAPYGTPIVAAHAGTVSYGSSSSGGLQAYLQASSGTYTFYAHMSSYGAAGGSVSPGSVIGYVGSTGNAGSTNHLHFEYHPGGGAAVNPYQMLLAVC